MGAVTPIQILNQSFCVNRKATWRITNHATQTATFLLHKKYITTKKHLQVHI